MKHLQLLTVGAICSALVVTAAPSIAQEGKEKRQREQGQSRMVVLLDTDGDGKVSSGEIAAEHERLMGAADINADGKLSVEEFRRRGRWFQALGVTTLFDLMDSNGDQILTLEEIQAPSQRWVKRYDGNGDDAIEQSEFPQKRRHRRHRH